MLTTFHDYFQAAFSASAINSLIAFVLINHLCPILMCLSCPSRQSCLTAQQVVDMIRAVVGISCKIAAGVGEADSDCGTTVIRLLLIEHTPSVN
jgi:hypothetical protein